MNIVITRLFTKGEFIHGKLTIDGNRVCDTLENATSCVPAGEYVITLSTLERCYVLTQTLLATCVLNSLSSAITALYPVIAQ